MRISFDIWKKQLLGFSDNTKGYLKIVKTPSVGYGADYLTATINYKENKINVLQSAVKINLEVDLSYLIFECCIGNSDDLTIRINQRDFFDKIFSGGGISSGNKIFDKKFVVKSSDKKVAFSLFKEDRVQKLFLENSLLIFNVVTEKGKSIIKMKNMAKRLYTEDEMLYYLKEFKFIVKILE